MAKVPLGIPIAAGQKVRLRANKNRTGVIVEMTQHRWCHMAWDDGSPVPKMCHQYELIALPIDGSVNSGV